MPEEKEIETEEKMVSAWVPYGITSFSEVDATQEAEEVAEDVQARASQFRGLVDNVMGSSEVDDKAGAIERISTEFVALVKERLGDIFGKAKTVDDEKPEMPGFMLWKEADGSYRWLARYSNNFRDEDDPPEIISATSHRQFDEMLSKAEAPMPDLWLWHRPEWKWGQTTWHAYDDAGFALAGGVVDKGKEWLADHLMALDPALVRVSHGMPTKSIVRDADDPSVIVGHVTREISPLPAWAAANPHTGFIILKEAIDMAIPQEKRAALKEEWNLSDELLTQLEAANTADAKEAEEAGIEHKEVEVTEESQPEAEAAPEVSEPEPGVSRAEMTEALEAIGEAIKVLAGQIKEVQGQVIEVKEEKAVEEEATLGEIFKRAIGHADTRVDGRTKDAKDRPAEVKTAPEEIVNTGNPLSDSIVNQIVSGEFMDGIRGEQPTQ